MSNAKVLQDYHVELAIYWQDVEGLTLSQINDRLITYFENYEGVSEAALSQRINRLRKDKSYGIKSKKSIPNPASLTDSDLLDWLRALMYEEVFIAKAKSDSIAIRKSADSMLKVLRAKKELTSIESDDDKAAKQLLKEIQNAYNVEA